jgi:hypothetical protein
MLADAGVAALRSPRKSCLSLLITPTTGHTPITDAAEAVPGHLPSAGRDGLAGGGQGGGVG